MSSGIFRISNRRFHLTYKTHLDHTEWLMWAGQEISKIKEYSIVHETGDEHHDYPHTHIYVEFEKKLNSRREDFFNFKLHEDNEYWTDSFWENYRKDKNEEITGIHPNISPVKTDQHREHLINVYHRKEGVPFTNILTGEEIALKEQEEKKSSCKKCNKEKYAKKHTCGLVELKEETPKIGLNELQEKINEDPNFDIVSYYAGDDISKISRLEKAMTYIKKPVGAEPKVLWRPWQMDILEELTNFNSDRTIVWVADPYFRSGKSSFCEHLDMFYKTMFLVDLEGSSVGCQIRTAHEKLGKEIKNIIIDLPRGYKMPDDAYNTLECLKNGVIVSKKYNSTKIKFTGSYNKKPNVFVFSNELPDFDKLSPDKLGLILLDEKGVDVKERNFLELPEIVLPEGYQKPGTILEVAKPDEIVEDGLYFKDFNFKFSEEEKKKSREYWIKYALQTNKKAMEKTINERKKIKSSIEKDNRLKELIKYQQE